MEFRRNPDYEDLQGEVTPESLFLDRRRMMTAAGVLGAGSILGALPACSEPQQATAVAPGAKPAAGTHPAPGASLTAKKTSYAVADQLASEDAVTGYNNFYEFGTDKSDPARYADKMTVSPWSISVEGETDKPGAYGVKDLVDYAKLEERVYRHRCVEAWSMVVPWVGVPMADVIAKLKPKATAKFVQFETYLNRKEMPGVRLPVLSWPYVEGLRMDEAMNELAFMAVGVYGKALPKQNGAPIRTVLPWKYGFKATKSIVKIRFMEKQPATAWNKAGANEYGFYSNVNPDVDHPRWSQSSERVIGGKGFNERRKTDMFNGYSAQVSKLYAGMDLKKNF
ncbi:MAG: protein-methionine-sulfoxide reductase catalytic subunit MsrP [Alphaproteobacteria bacterium]|nr:protein-methionine-sulfoxide reductase catalytic subunit MsrP [Alphaproteobacteria bacterium]